MNVNDGVKYMSLGIVMGLGSLIPAYTVGDSVENTLMFYDNYNTK